MGILSKNSDKQNNASQAKVSSGGGGFGHENMRDYEGSQPSGCGFGGTIRNNSDFGFGGGPIVLVALETKNNIEIV